MTPLPLAAVLDRLRARDLVVAVAGDPSRVALTSVTQDSRAAAAGTLFVAVRGTVVDGHRFAGKALAQGAAALLVEEDPARYALGGAVVVQVTNTRAALADVAALVHGDPSERLALCGVTGTNGKTTSTFLLHHVFQTVTRRPAGLIGTIETRVGDVRQTATHTTPEPLALQALFRQMVDAGCTHAAMEVSSHALAQERTRATRFACGVFTNLTRDHLDYHETFEAYEAAKRLLFDGLDEAAVAVYNADDPAGARMVARTKARCVSFGQQEGADVRFEIVENALSGLVLALGGRTQRYRLVGGFNAYNLAGAFAAATAMGLDAEAVLDALAGAAPVPGRFEQFVDAQGRVVVVDYAHTPDALDNVLRAMRATMPPNARLWVVFGCGGDRDQGKRPEMARVAESGADHVVVTSDNPRTEDPEAILRDVRAGFARPDAPAFVVDRRAAIAYAAAHAAPGDAVLVAGKGHEPYQILGTETVHFDDREEVQALFAARPPAPTV